MMKDTRMVSVVATGLLALTCVGPTWAQEKVERPKTTPETEAVERVAAAYTMIKAGRDANAPEMLLAAARIIGKTNFQKLNLKDAKLGNKVEQGDPAAEAAALIAEAIKSAGSNVTAVTALAAAVQDDIRNSAKERGGLPGPYNIYGIVDYPYDKTDAYYLDFRGNQEARIYVHNLSNHGDIDVTVFDLDGRLVAQDHRAAASAYVRFHPSRDNRYRVVVRAYSGALLRYHLTTN